jgi:hypothetical protein
MPDGKISPYFEFFQQKKLNNAVTRSGLLKDSADRSGKTHENRATGGAMMTRP